MSNFLLIGIIIILIILIIIFTIATLWLRTDFNECESTQSPYCPYFTCPSSGALTPGGVIDQDTNYGPGYNAILVRPDNTVVKKTNSKGVMSVVQSF